MCSHKLPVQGRGASKSTTVACTHKKWIRFYPPKGTVWFEMKSDKPGVSHSSHVNDTYVIRICVKCGKILEVKDYGA